jgi:hypothetical protein
MIEPPELIGRLEIDPEWLAQPDAHLQIIEPRLRPPIPPGISRKSSVIQGRHQTAVL